MLAKSVVGCPKVVRQSVGFGRAGCHLVGFFAGRSSVVRSASDKVPVNCSVGSVCLILTYGNAGPRLADRLANPLKNNTPESACGALSANRSTSPGDRPKSDIKFTMDIPAWGRIWRGRQCCCAKLLTKGGVQLSSHIGKKKRSQQKCWLQFFAHVTNHDRQWDTPLGSLDRQVFPCPTCPSIPPSTRSFGTAAPCNKGTRCCPTKVKADRRPRSRRVVLRGILLWKNLRT